MTKEQYDNFKVDDYIFGYGLITSLCRKTGTVHFCKNDGIGYSVGFCNYADIKIWNKEKRIYE